MSPNVYDGYSSIRLEFEQKYINGSVRPNGDGVYPIKSNYFASGGFSRVKPKSIKNIWIMIKTEIVDVGFLIWIGLFTYIIIDLVKHTISKI